MDEELTPKQKLIEKITTIPYVLEHALEYVKFTDYEAERKAHEETKARLEALEDAILTIDADKLVISDSLSYAKISGAIEKIEQALQNAKERGWKQ